MTAYYKATLPDGTDFHTGRIDYGAALLSGDVVRHPSAEMVPGDAATYLSVSVSEADCTGFSWPCRLFRVDPIGDVLDSGDYPSKRCVSALRVVEELPAWRALGPNGEAVAALIEQSRSMTPKEAGRLGAAWAAAWDAARDAAWAAARAAAWDAARAAAWDAAWAAAWAAARAAARAAAWDAARDAAWAAARAAAWDAARAAAWDAAWAAAWAAARALVVRDLITPEQFGTLYGPWASVFGEAAS